MPPLVCAGTAREGRPKAGIQFPPKLFVQGMDWQQTSSSHWLRGRGKGGLVGLAVEGIYVFIY